jgi:hypothetical protein
MSTPARGPRAARVDDDIIHDDACAELEDCIMNNDAPVQAALAIPSRAPPRARRSPPRRRMENPS